MFSTLQKGNGIMPMSAFFSPDSKSLEDLVDKGLLDPDAVCNLSGKAHADGEDPLNYD
jgi:hypothetical protein